MSIELRNVEKTVDGMTHIHSTNLALQTSEFNVLLGPTLSGKTTLMRLIAGLDKPTAGEVWFDGKNVTSLSVQNRNIAMVYQAFINYPNFTVFENIASPLRVAGISNTEIRKRVGEMAELLDLSDLLDRDVSQLSGGQQQRTALARALVKKALLVLLDEPLANLDYKLREQLRDELPRLFADSGTTVVYATGEPEEALMLGGYTATLHEGAVLQYGKTIDIYRQPHTLECAKIFSHPPVNIASVLKRQDKVSFFDTAEWDCPDVLKSHPDGPYTLGVRPHHLTLSRTSENEKSVGVRGTVQIAEINGSTSLIHLEVQKNNWISESSGVHQFTVGDEIEVHINLQSCLYFDVQGCAIFD